MDLTEKRKSARSLRDAEDLDKMIHSIDSAIDRAVYELYGLTEDEVRMVEEV
jgi:hypothetical protein